MRQAYELAYITALLFSKSPATFVSLDDIIFKKPVPIGSFLSLTAHVVYSMDSPHNTFQVKVVADVMNHLQPSLETIERTNIFHFTFKSNGASIPKIMPKTYEESMSFIEGKRRKEMWLYSIEKRGETNEK
jgi:acyl-coenzyme A thioesterase 9